MVTYQTPLSAYNDTARIAMELKKEDEHAKAVAQAYVKHFYNEQGEQLAKVEDSEAFQEVYDYHGDQKRRHKLARKMEQIHNTYDARTHLFQKVYYSKGLTLADERMMRDAYEQSRSAYERNLMINNAVVFGAYLPATYWMSRQVRPITVGLWTVAWWYGYKSFTVPLVTSSF